MTPSQPLSISAYTSVSAAGIGKAATAQALLSGRSGLAANDLDWAPLPCWIGRVPGIGRVEAGRDLAEDLRLPAALADYDCRNNRLALLALEQDGFMAAAAAAKTRHGAARMGVFLGTSTSGILSTELAYQRRQAGTGELPADYRYQTTHNMDASTEFVRRLLGLSGPAMTISTACSSSAKVFALAERFMRLGLIDAAVVGGVDSLCLTTLYGFNALQLVASDICRPFDRERRGLSIGEAAGFALLEKTGGPLQLLGYGETSDAHHMSTPAPLGEGAQRAMREALARARLGVEDIDYINLHGTATPANDLAEGQAVRAVFGSATPCSSTKGFTGHTLGAAGITEAAMALLSLEHGFIPGSPTTRNIDPACDCGIVLQGRAQPIERVMSNSFGFGGSNCALIFGKKH